MCLYTDFLEESRPILSTKASCILGQLDRKVGGRTNFESMHRLRAPGMVLPTPIVLNLTDVGIRN